jgi:hypothetical protein
MQHLDSIFNFNSTIFTIKINIKTLTIESTHQLTEFKNRNQNQNPEFYRNITEQRSSLASPWVYEEISAYRRLWRHGGGGGACVVYDLHLLAWWSEYWLEVSWNLTGGERVERELNWRLMERKWEERKWACGIKREACAWRIREKIARGSKMHARWDRWLYFKTWPTPPLASKNLL